MLMSAYIHAYFDSVRPSGRRPKRVDERAESAMQSQAEIGSSAKGDPQLASLAFSLLDSRLGLAPFLSPVSAQAIMPPSSSLSGRTLVGRSVGP